LYESNGSFSALPKPDYAEEQTSLPVILIKEGKLDEKNLRLTKRKKEYFFNIFEQNGCKNPKKLLVATVDGNGKLYFQERGKKFGVVRLNWQEKLW
jgi:uncharacterized membrane protein YcaP (DUF421 family)